MVLLATFNFQFLHKNEPCCEGCKQNQNFQDTYLEVCGALLPAPPHPLHNQPSPPSLGNPAGSGCETNTILY